MLKGEMGAMLKGFSLQRGKGSNAGASIVVQGSKILLAMRHPILEC